MRNNFSAAYFGVSALAVVAAAAWAQDARSVTEPVIPAACATLDAHLAATTDGTYDTLAPADEGKLDTGRIQAAMDGCARGHAVVLRTQGKANAFLSGPLHLRDGVTLVVDKGAVLFAAIDASVFDVRPGSCGVVKPGIRPGCQPLISVDGVKDAGIMGDGIIDGRGGVLLPGQTQSYWDIAQHYEGQQRGLMRLVIADHADNFTLYRITFKNSPNFHIVYNGGDGFTVWGVKIDTPRRLPRSQRPLAHNTDGIDPGHGARNITITHSYIRTGDDNVAIKGSSGGVSNMTVSHNHFYWGHGMSIGSETYGGVSKILVSDLTLDGTDAGLRIKSAQDRGGLVRDVTYENVCVRNSPHPILLTTSYGAAAVAGSPDARPPSYVGLVFRNIEIWGGGEIAFEGFAGDRRIQALLDNVHVMDAGAAGIAYAYKAKHADVTIGDGGGNLALPTGNDVTLTGKPDPRPATSHCAGRFVPFP